MTSGTKNPFLKKSSIPCFSDQGHLRPPETTKYYHLSFFEQFPIISRGSSWYRVHILSQFSINNKSTLCMQRVDSPTSYNSLENPVPVPSLYPEN